MASKLLSPSFKWGKISRRQKTVMGWWCSPKYKDCDGIIADGAIRSGKTVSMGFSYVIWAMTNFDRMNFGLCGKTIESFRRNVLGSLKAQLRARGYTVQERKSENLVVVTNGEKGNFFYLFGGKDERSQDLIQGITLAGCFFDEVALMPESFVNQATARCSIEGSKFWFNCNPAGPFHWFYVNWIKKRKQRNLLYLHFTMADNLTLSKKIKKRYEAQYTGVFFKRFILGLWVVAEGIIYDMFSMQRHVLRDMPALQGDIYVSSDFGIQNATVFLVWQQDARERRWVCKKEYYYSGRDNQKQKTVEELVDDLTELLAGEKPKQVIVDPSATALIVELRKRGYRVRKAKNDVLDGITAVSSALMQDLLAFYIACKGTIREFGIYAWDKKAADRGEDKPIKEKDHGMDAVRYFVNTVDINIGEKYISPLTRR